MCRDAKFWNQNAWWLLLILDYWKHERHYKGNSKVLIKRKVDGALLKLAHHSKDGDDVLFIWTEVICRYFYMNSLIRFFYSTFLTTVLCSEESREFLLDVSSLLTDYIVRSWLEIRVTRPTILNMHTIAYIMHAGG